MKLKAIRPHYCDGNVMAVGAVYETADKLGRELIASGKAIAAPAAVDAPPARRPKAPKPAPMSVASVPALVPGAITEPEGDLP